MNCLFCQIIKKEIPAHIIYEDDNYLSFLDINPNTKGHVLVIPKKHTPDFNSLTDEEAGSLAFQVHYIASRLSKALNTKNYNLGLNNGSQAGQIVNHVHWHIIPRYKDDGLKHWTSNKEERELLAETLKILKGKI